MDLIVLCCGSRYWNDKHKIEKEFDKLEKEGHKVVLVIQGGANGADLISKAVAESRGIQVCTFHANWWYYKNPAGPIRNSNQIKFIVPNRVLAFHHNIVKSSGTRDMVEKARKKGLKVKIIA